MNLDALQPHELCDYIASHLTPWTVDSVTEAEDGGAAVTFCQAMAVRVAYCERRLWACNARCVSNIMAALAHEERGERLYQLLPASERW